MSRIHWTWSDFPACKRTMLAADLRRMKVSRIPERVTCLRCLRALRNVGLVAEGKLRAAGEAT